MQLCIHLIEYIKYIYFLIFCLVKANRRPRKSRLCMVGILIELPFYDRNLTKAQKQMRTYCAAPIPVSYYSYSRALE